MSYNIYVKFKKNNAPTKDDIENTLKNYISSGGNITHDEVCFYVTLIGKPQYPFYHEDPMPRRIRPSKPIPQSRNPAGSRLLLKTRTLHAKSSYGKKSS
jgi:hypothetical protein